MGKNAVSCVIGGLADAMLKRAAKAENFENVEDLLEFLKNCSTQPNDLTDRGI